MFDHCDSLRAIQDRPIFTGDGHTCKMRMPSVLGRSAKSPYLAEIGHL